MPKILLAEDNEIMRISIYDKLKKHGWHVDEAEDGLKAMALFERHQYHLIISDIRMPGLDGLTLLQNVHRQSPDTDVIIMTAYGSVDDAIDCLRKGAAEYILKPLISTISSSGSPVFLQPKRSRQNAKPSKPPANMSTVADCCLANLRRCTRSNHASNRRLRPTRLF